MIPDGNNVYGRIQCAEDLENALAAVEELVPDSRVWIYTSEDNGAKTLHISADSVVFMSDPLGNARHFFNGAVGGDLSEVVDLASRLSAALTRAGIPHHFEVNDDDENIVAEYGELKS
jgi:hypothetical protein